jgi:hypothetical protein
MNLPNMLKKTFWACFNNFFQTVDKSEIEFYLEMLTNFIYKELLG